MSASENKLWSFADTAYFVFGENLEVYNTNKQTHQDFMEAGLEFIKQVGLLVPLPIFKHIPSIAYRKFIQATRRMRALGNCNRISKPSLTCHWPLLPRPFKLSLVLHSSDPCMQASR